MFLLAIDPGEFGSFSTTDTELKAASDGLPDAVRYDGTVYEIRDGVGGGADHVYLPLKEWAGIALVGLGAVLFFTFELPAQLNQPENNSP
ncbi:hypothetical protein [Halobacterium sp. R2-5]|uniref:hypothetical protein n=1 Tax=Halobacterium sp. R2-5 TaxID=2715751 RepID=UPI001423857E|nr:hypothetical protein [Halobacterium sp. R2-5]NIC00983.1 hypothetical protein [Halobacterium sp. R2-5]